MVVESAEESTGDVTLPRGLAEAGGVLFTGLAAL